MRIRKMMAFMLALCLCLSCVPAYAAPMRDARNAEVAHDGIQALIEVVFSAYLWPEWEETVSQGRQEILSLGLTVRADEGVAEPLAQRSLAYAMERSQQTTVLSRAEAARLLSQVWTGWTAPQETDSDLLRVTGDTVELLPEKMENGWRAGAYLYDITFTDEGARVRADAYACPADYAQGLEDMPEEAVVWLLNGDFSLRSAPEAVFGYTVDDCVFSPVYEDGLLSAWQEIDSEKGEYSVCLPALFALREDVALPALGTEWKSADGSAEISVYYAGSEKTFAETLENFNNAHAHWTVRTEEEFGRMYGFGEGAFEMWVTSPEMKWTYCVLMRFPAGRQAEYEFYADLIRNSFIAWGISNG